MVLVCLLMYCFHESEPDSLPLPVSFSPPNAPPISAPEVPPFTLAKPQSEPSSDRNFSASLIFKVKIDEGKNSALIQKITPKPKWFRIIFYPVLYFSFRKKDYFNYEN